MHLKAHSITYKVAVLFLGLSFLTENTYGVSEAVNIFMFTDFSLVTGTKATMITRCWVTSLE